MRGYALEGSSGSGKTQLVSHLASTLNNEADFQLHTLDSWDISGVDLATEILRYASIPLEDDPLLTLERAAARLSKPCVVIIDGMSAQAQLDRLGRQIDSLLRQVTIDGFKFVLAIRTPPDVGFSSFPVLAASLYEPSIRSTGTSYLVTSWDERTAREVWALSRGDSDPSFTDLPESIQQLARLPLYMELLKTVGDTASLREINAYRLLDHCVRSILRMSGSDVDQALEVLEDLAQHEMSYLIPTQLLEPKVSAFGRSVDAPVQADTNLDLTPLIERRPPGRVAFGHDLIREYALATRIARLMVAQGRSNTTVSALNELAIQSTSSATARGLFEFVVYAIDSYSPESAARFALAPTVAVTTTLPIMLRLARSGAQFANKEVLVARTRRCASDGAIEVARSLLAIPSIATALGDAYTSWILTVLERFGARIWPDTVAHIAATLHVDNLEPLLTAVDMDKSAHATFLARYFYRFADGSHQQSALLEQLLAHPDWRVRRAGREPGGRQHMERHTQLAHSQASGH